MNYAGPNRRGGHPVKYRLTPEAEALIRDRYKAGRRETGRREIAEALGVPAWVVSRWASQLGLVRRKEPFWTDTDLDYLRENFGRMSYRRIARHLGRSIESVGIKANRIGIRLDAASEVFTVADVAAGLGIDRTRVEDWVKRGWLNGFRATDRTGTLRCHRSDLKTLLRQHGWRLDLSRVDAAWLFEIAFGPSEYRGEACACRHCSAVFFSRLETRVETACAACAAREHERRVA